MGMAASQARFLSLTSRKSDLTLELQSIALQKNSMTRDTDAITEKYHEALNSKLFVFSNNAGVTYSKFNYYDLMSPSSLNLYDPKLVTDMSGRVVVDNKYKQYAEMLSENGAPGAKWEGDTRIKILSELLGIDAEKLQEYSTTQQAVWDKEYAMNQLEATPTKDKFKKSGVNNLLKKMTSSAAFSGGYSNWSDAYSNNATITLGSNATQASATFKNILNSLKTLAPYFLDDAESFEKACENISNAFSGTENLTEKSEPVKKDGSNYVVDVKTIIDSVLGASNAEKNNNGYAGQTQYYWYDIDSDAYKTWKMEHAAWDEKRQNLINEYNTSVNANNLVLTADQEGQIKFYDNLFSSIAERGWVNNSNITDPDYLNQVLLNNMYTITTVDRTLEKTENKQEGKYDCKWVNTYDENIASNCSFLYTVNDTDAANEALVEYEHEKSILNKKEAALDAREQNIKTELSSINQWLQSLQSIMQKNIETNFSIFS